MVLRVLRGLRGLRAAVVEAVAGAVPVLVDGGIRRGTDVLKALALGARAVLVGRPVLVGLAADGARGVAVVLRRLLDEFQAAQALSGCHHPAEAASLRLLGPGFGVENIFNTNNSHL